VRVERGRLACRQASLAYAALLADLRMSVDREERLLNAFISRDNPPPRSPNRPRAWNVVRRRRLDGRLPSSARSARRGRF